MVPRKRLELSRLTALAPKASVSTNSTTWAQTIKLPYYFSENHIFCQVISLKIQF